MVAHFTATLYFWVASAESMVTWSSVLSRCGRPRSKYFSWTSTLGRMSWGCRESVGGGGQCGVPREQHHAWWHSQPRPPPQPSHSCLPGTVPPVRDGPPSPGPPHLQVPPEAALISPPASCRWTDRQRTDGQGGQCAGTACPLYNSHLFPCTAPASSTCATPQTEPRYLLLDESPDDPRHLISVHLHHRVGHLDPLVGI